LWSYGIFSAKGETKPMPILGDLSKMVFKYLLILIPQSPFSPSLTSRPKFLKSQIKKLSLNYLIRDQNVDKTHFYFYFTDMGAMPKIYFHLHELPDEYYVIAAQAPMIFNTAVMLENHQF
jgi:hypothetical protein